MKKLCYYIIAIAISTILSSCSAAYWSGASFSGDAMYDTYSPTKPNYVSTSGGQSSVVNSEQPTTYYQRPDSYYQYQYIPTDEVAEVASYDPNTYSAELMESDSIIVIDPKYASSTYGIWEEEEIAESNVYINVSYGYNPWWGWGYDPFYYNSYWGYPYYSYRPLYHYGWWYRPHHIYVPNRPRPNIVQRPSAGSPSSTRGGSYRGQSVGTTTSGRFNRATTTNSSSSSSSTTRANSSSSNSSSNTSSTTKRTTTQYSAPTRPTSTRSTTTTTPSRSSYSTPSSSSSSSSRTSSGGGTSYR